MSESVRSFNAFRRLRRYALPVAVVCVAGVAGCSSVAAPAEAAQADSARRSAPNCFAEGAYAAREACFALMPKPDFDECRRSSPGRCVPYAAMHRSEAELRRLIEETKTQVRKRAARYAGVDPAYATDILNGIDRDQTAWAAWRDARCELEPFLDGMARSEAADLTEQCRLDETLDRTAAVRRRLRAISAENAQ